MLQLFAFRRSLRVDCTGVEFGAFAAAVTPASARPHHGRHARGYHAGHHARHYAHPRHRHIARVSRWERGVARMQAGGFADTNGASICKMVVDQNSTLTPTGGAMGAGFRFPISAHPASSPRRAVISAATRPAAAACGARAS